MSQPLLQVQGLGIRFPVGGGLRPRWLRAAHDIDFSLRRGEILALVGESGSGKSTIARMIARLLQPASGRILLDGEDVLKTEPRTASLAYRGRVQMVFQDPFASLNPTKTVFHHVARPLQLHGKARGAELRPRVLELLSRCGLDPAADFIDAFPHSLSGGQRQRVTIARALAPEPDLLLADEPTGNLDPANKGRVLDLLFACAEARATTLLVVTHDHDLLDRFGRVIDFRDFHMEDRASDVDLREAA